MFPKVSAGGGIEKFSGSMTVDTSTISGNRAETASSGTSTDGAGGSGRPLVAIRVKGHGVSYRTDRTVQATVTLDANAGPCFTARFPGAPGPVCRVKKGGATLRCR